MSFRFNSPLVFFNAPYFKRCALDAANAAAADLRWFILDTISITECDATGLVALRDLNEDLAARGVTLVMAGRVTETNVWLQECGLGPTRFDRVTFRRCAGRSAPARAPEQPSRPSALRRRRTPSPDHQILVTKSTTDTKPVVDFPAGPQYVSRATGV